MNSFCFVGCLKKMKINRKVQQMDGSIIQEEKILNVEVKRGWKAGTKITFPKEGDRFINKTPADVIFTIKDRPHMIFNRDGNDLLYTVTVTLKQALCGCTIEVPTLINKIPIQFVNEIISPKTKKRIQGYGLPKHKNPNCYGDLIVSFYVIFPEFLNPPVKDVLFNCLP